MDKRLIIILAIILTLCVVSTIITARADPANVSEIEVSHYNLSVDPGAWADDEEPEPEFIPYKVPLERDLQKYIKSCCDFYGVPMELVLAVIWQESNYQAQTISDTDDYGLMQINKCNHEEVMDSLGVNDIMNPYDNVKAGTWLLSRCIGQADGNINNALMMYNCGYTGAKRLLAKDITSTRYSRSVISRMEKIK